MSSILLTPKFFEAAIRDALISRKVCTDAVEHVTASLLETSLRGVDSHGIRLLPHYCRAVEGGRINRSPDFLIQRRAAAAATLDARDGFGHHAGAAAMDLAIQLARGAGVGTVSVTHSSHFGAASYFALRAARAGFVAMAFTNADALVKAHDAKQRFFGTNPVCFCAPMDGEDPFCLDMATSRIAWNKLRGYALRGESLPDEVAYDAEGAPVTDPNLAHSLAPTGGYKGFGLGMMVDILCALLAGGPISPDILPMYGTPLHQPRDISHFFLAIDPGRFAGAAAFSAGLAAMAARVRSLTPVGRGQPQVAGDPEKRVMAQRLAEGIPVAPEVYRELRDCSPRFENAVRSAC